MQPIRPWLAFVSLMFLWATGAFAQEYDEFFVVPEDTILRYFAENQPDVPPDSIANYRMDVTLDVNTKLIDGKMRLVWQNATAFPATDLYFHLYYNAWRNNKSSFLNSVRYNNRDVSGYGEADWGYCEIKTIRIVPNGNFEGEDVLSKLVYEQPDDGNSADRTVMRLPLLRSVFPGETIELDIEWVSKVPRPVARTGYLNDYFFIAQWFPKIAVFDPNGMWNVHQFIQTEFYADFGTYDVRLTVPKNWQVGATGREISRVDTLPNTTVYHYFQNAVHDFVWVTSPVFREFYQQFEMPGLPPVDMRLLLMPYNLDKRERYFQAAATALNYYGTWYGPYPYGHITIIDPAYQSQSGGMEYPTLFTGGARWLSPPGSRQPESVTIHEAGHQFWYGLIANNEFEHAWLDEGINTYSQHRIFRQHLSRWQLTRRYMDDFLPLVYNDVFRAERSDGADMYRGLESGLKRDAMSTPSWKNGPGAYRINAYNRPALMLQTLENYLGWKTFQSVLSTFFERFRFHHPTPEDFFAVVNEVSGQDLSWFFHEAYFGTNVFDYAVGEVKSEKINALKGFDYDQDNLVFKSPNPEDAAAQTAAYRSTVYVRRWGEAIFPVEVKLTFDNGEEELERWDGRDRWKMFRYIKGAKLQKVEVDPSGKLVLDVNSVNNSWVRQSSAPLAAWKWTSKWMIWLQNVMELLAFFA